jgi:AhpD family alkylhydroperoxidase
VCGGVEPARLHLALDAQTSGGLLISIDPQRHERLLELLGESGAAGYTIGRIVERSSGRIRLCPTAPAEFAGKDQPIMAKCCDSASSSDKPAAHSGQCCAGPAGGTLPGTSAAALKAFGEFMRATSAGGALDEKTKELISLSLVVFSRCESCLEVHVEKARRMGITQAEMDEAAWLAVAMGGAPVRMFYSEVTGLKS